MLVLFEPRHVPESVAAHSCSWGQTIPAGLMIGPTLLAEGTKAARSKSVIFVWMWGAPSHIDTFDPKPDAPSQYRGPFAPISTRQPGVYFSELLPKLAARSDQFSLIRSQRCSMICRRGACWTRRSLSPWANLAARRESPTEPREITGRVAIFRCGPEEAYSPDAQSERVTNTPKIPLQPPSVR
ncbi:MAG: DUF1501 domain-containing protein [Fuerstia sp.]|nr:DUF1501 domain-containing protein [Fuerstiella sp.]